MTRTVPDNILSLGRPRFPARVCAEPGCETKLSCYNADTRCYVHREAEVARYIAAPAVHSEYRTYALVCQECGAEFVGRRWNGKFCGSECRSRNWHRSQRQAVRA
jgi:hypothetical protein